jgi:hypothetical protein
MDDLVHDQLSRKRAQRGGRLETREMRPTAQSALVGGSSAQFSVAPLPRGQRANAIPPQPQLARDRAIR